MYEVGAHYVLEMYGCPPHLLDDLDFVKGAVRDAAEEARTTLLQDVAHKFHPQGVTALALLAESHLSIHTWPELGYVAADAFTCGDRADPRKACESFVTAFRPKSYSMRKIDRSAPPGSQDFYDNEERIRQSAASDVSLEQVGPVRN